MTFMPLPEAVRTLVGKAEHVALCTHADALNHDRIPEYGVEERNAKRRYDELCDALLVCRRYGCYARTEYGYCGAHKYEL